MKLIENDDHEKRKSEHIDIVLNKPVTSIGLTTGFENYRLVHQALPDINFQDISLKTTFLDKPLRTPFLISSMTGGTKIAGEINRHLAIAAEEHGWAMGIGSTRAAIENSSLTDTFQIRQYAPTIPILANLGAVQLNYGYGIEECQKAVEMLEADGLVLHLNSMQEVFQMNGDTNFKGLLDKIELVCHRLSVPVGVKEVGFGIHGRHAKQLFEAGVAFVDVAGAGGTSWIRVEANRTNDMLLQEAAEVFKDWGISTSDSLVDVRNHVAEGKVIASGGMKSGVDAAKAIALGADLVGYGKSILANAIDSTEALSKQLSKIERELQIAMFGVGTSTIEELKQASHLIIKS